MGVDVRIIVLEKPLLIKSLGVVFALCVQGSMPHSPYIVLTSVSMYMFFSGSTLWQCGSGCLWH